MKDKAKEQPINDLEKSHQRIAKLEELENKCRRIEKALQKTEKRLKMITDNMLDVITQTDSDRVFQYVSPSIKDLLGYEPEDIIGKQAFELVDIVHPEDLKKIVSAVQNAIKTHSHDTVQHRYRHIDGHYVWVETVGNPIFDNNGQFKGAVFSTRDITDRKKAEDQIKRSLKEKEILLREIHHRVKNNLQVISSLLSLQSRYIKDKEAFELFKESQARVKSIAGVHKKLYQSEDLTRVDFADYIKSLSSDLLYTYAADPNLIKLNINVEDVSLNIETAIPLGLIVNELLTNSIKHAFPDGRSGEINVDFRSVDDKFIVVVSDDGVGFPEGLDFRATETLGLQLVTILTEQIEGTIELDRSHGTEFKIVFREEI